MPLQYSISGATSEQIASSVEDAIRDERLVPGDVLPTVRALAGDLGVSPTTVAASYRELARRGVVMGEGRRGTRVRPAPPVAGRLPIAVPRGVLDLRTGGPDPMLLPALPRIGRFANHTRAVRYGEPSVSEKLATVAMEKLAAEGVETGSIAAVGGALDGVERVLDAWLRPGDKVAVEDPGYTAVLDLLAALGLKPVPLEVDQLGVRPVSLERVVERGIAAAVLTPRAQNPTGAAWDEERAASLRALLSRRQDVLLVEDDHAGPAAGLSLHSICAGRRRWATIRSVSKWLGPDLRLAVVAGDPVTVSRVEGRQALGTGWVSHVLQEMVAEMWSDPGTAATLEEAARVYSSRRDALVDALGAEGIAATARSGLTLWVPVADEHAVVAGLMDHGIAVAPGEPFRIESPPGIRIALATLQERDAPRVAGALSRVLKQRSVRFG